MSIMQAESVVLAENHAESAARNLVAPKPVTTIVHRVPMGLGMVSSTNHITAGAGEDVSSKIISFCWQNPGVVIIRSASGTLSAVTISQPEISDGIITYEGRFHILSISGFFMPGDVDGQAGRSGELSVSFFEKDKQVVSGNVAGRLIAASPVQIVLCSLTYPLPPAEEDPGLR